MDTFYIVVFEEAVILVSPSIDKSNTKQKLRDKNVAAEIYGI